MGTWMTIVGEGCLPIYPSFAKEGYMRPKENAAKHPLRSGRGGCFKHPLNRWLETTTPSAPSKEGGRFLLCAATPASRRRGIFRVRNRLSQNASRLSQNAFLVAGESRY